MPNHQRYQQSYHSSYNADYDVTYENNVNAGENTAKAIITAKADGNALDLMDDNMVRGIPVIYDTNGAKGPNILSNCSGKALGTAKDTSDISDCAKKSNRVIKDQFGVRLRGGVAVPNGAAARWAYEN